ncbi:MAG: carbohydrate porin [Acidithiobacillus sp.]
MSLWDKRVTVIPFSVHCRPSGAPHLLIFLQPDLQWVIHPGGLYPNALVAGLSSHVQLF